MTTPPAPLVPQPDSGRTYNGARKVRLGDVTQDGRLRFDGLTRYTQDVSNDDTTDAGLSDETAWVVRRTTVDVLRTARLGEAVALTTFCGALGPRWAERRVSVVGERGARYEVATLWVHLDPMTGAPASLTEEFLDLYGEAAQGRRISARRELPGADDPAITSAVGRLSWPVRAVDFDTQNHMNNAAYWAAVEELLASDPIAVPLRASIEYAGGIAPGQGVELLTAGIGNARHLWWQTPEGVPAAARLEPLGDDWPGYPD